MLKFKPWRTSGNHEWSGAMPIFIARATISSVVEIGSEKGFTTHSPLVQALITAENKIMAAAAA